MSRKSVTESTSHYDDLEKMSIKDLLVNINKEDATVASAVERSIPQIENLVNAILPNMLDGGRLFYIGSGTSGRLGIVDASECPPTYGVPHDLVIGIMAGGDGAIRKAVEFAEDHTEQGWRDLQAYQISEKDSVIGIAASGRTPYVVGAIRSASEAGVTTGCITCNPETDVAKACQYPVEVIVGPEFVTGSTRMKAGTAQKLVLNMISTSLMVKLGRVKGNRMVDMQLTNQKLMDRGMLMLMQELNIDRPAAQNLLERHGSVRAALNSLRS